MINRLTDGIGFQTQALMLRAERQRLLASNIANADTPNYQAKDMDFGKALRTAAQAAAGGQPAALPAATNARHLSVSTLGLASATREAALQAQTSADSNGVDMDRERASFVDNALKYEATLRFINGSVRTTLDAMRSHNAAG
ncbi:MAG: flagellar basal body rod protein FlgB [Inhella sp.]|jgi:flagellar basal-body rod protein FlgB|uniref:flagellar basal body rod protein FlgB n=1 Tax=Inhella sp. TaxID=1921806 RepID=UPI0022CD1812|nr:flagellar basal body rod protein FlgB [Inhella sp.]MCZ8236242.1 flagellar basal body rod protein FlgB [Inhella sp.]